jgi:hypothetical protein
VQTLVISAALLFDMLGGMTLQAQPYLHSNNPITMEEMTVRYFVEQPTEYFYDAKLYYLEGHNCLAAERIRTGAKAVSRAGATASPEGKKALLGSYLALNKKSDEIANNEHVSLARMNEIFSKSLYNLSNHQYTTAKDSWAKHAYKKSGEELTAAANNLRHAASWADEGLEKGGVATVNGARAMGKSLQEGTDWAEDKAKKGFESFGNLLTTIGNKLKKI